MSIVPLPAYFHLPLFVFWIAYGLNGEGYTFGLNNIILWDLFGHLLMLIGAWICSTNKAGPKNGA